jgi:hypothetical protein
MCLVGPHRDDLELRLGEQPAKGFASHGESWSFALALRLAAYELLRAEGSEPVLILDDVFAELDTAVVPRGGWQYGEHRETVFKILLSKVAKDENSTPEAVRQKVYLTNCERVPQFFRNPQTDKELLRYRAACENVGYKMP